MTAGRRVAVLLLSWGTLLAEEALKAYSDEEIVRYLAEFDRTYANQEEPQDDAVAALRNLEAAYLFLEAKGDKRTTGQAGLQEQILDLAIRGLNAPRRQLVNIYCAKALGELREAKGAEPLRKWLEGVLEEEWPNPQAVKAGFLSLAWIGPTDKPTLDLVLAHATGRHRDPQVADAAIEACCEWRELDGETRKRFFDEICTFLEVLSSNRHPPARKQYEAVAKERLRALRELGGAKRRFDSPAQAREWFRGNANTKWEKYLGPRFR